MLVLTGEPGIGKTALLEHAAGQAVRMRVLRTRGVQTEAEIPFASLLELLRPALAALPRIPRPQAEALESALALRPAQAQERFAVGAATLSLMAAFAEEAPLAVLIDDAHWLDAASASALLFAIRRLLADPIAVVIAARAEGPRPFDGLEFPTLRLAGLPLEDTERLLPGLTAQQARRLHAATDGNPLALLEIAAQGFDEAPLAPPDAPVLLSARLASLFLHRADELSAAARRALLLAAASHSGELHVLERAAPRAAVDLDALVEAERAGLVALAAGRVEFRHPLARSAIYAGAPADDRREAHRAIANVLPDRDVDLRAWHLASAAFGPDEAASHALAQAAERASERSAYSVAAAAFARAARLAPEEQVHVSLLVRAAAAARHAGALSWAVELLEEAEPLAGAQGAILALRGRIAAQVGPAADAVAVLSAAADDASADVAVELLAQATNACFYAGRSAAGLEAADRANRKISAGSSDRARFLAATARGMALVIGGDAAEGARSIREGIGLAEASRELQNDLELLPWLATAPLFLRDPTGRPLLERALRGARERAALGVLPAVLNLIARDQATSDEWNQAEATYGEAIELARESGQEMQLAIGFAGLAWLQSRRGRDAECRELAERALELSRRLGLGLFEVWALAAVGELELSRGRLEPALEYLHAQARLLRALEITDPDLSPAPELVDALIRSGRAADALPLAEEFVAAAEAKGQPWSVARAMRCRGMLADDGAESWLARALELHGATPDLFETARTRLVLGERLRRDRQRSRARDELREAVRIFERLGAPAWAERAIAELAATGETHRGRDPAGRDRLTPQELRIALALASGRTTRETAAAMFLSPKTIEYHLRHVYQKLAINSRAQLAAALAEPGD